MRDGLIVGDAVVAWVAERLGVNGDTAQARGIGWAKDGKIAIGLMFYGYTEAHIFVHVARDKATRLTPTLIAAMIDYPFVQLGCAYLRAFISESNGAAIDFARKLGANLEAELQDGLPSANILIFGLPRSEATRWLTASYSRRLRKGG
jgi:RimJ/RimL family protein N-acetyltransferase